MFAAVITNENPQNLQNVDQREIVKATGAKQVRSPERISEDVANAFFRAKEENDHFLNMPADYMWQK